MSDPSLVLQKAQRDALMADAELKIMIGCSVYDEPPTDACMPYVVIGDAEVNDDSTSCGMSSEAFSFVDVWTNVPGYPLAKGIAAHVRRILSPELPLEDGFIMLSSEHQQTQFMRDPNPMIRRARLRFHHHIEHPQEG